MTPREAVAAVDDTGLLAGIGRARSLGANSRVLLDEAARAWIVTSGEVRIFAVEKVDGLPEGPLHSLFSCGPGSILLGTDREDLPFVLCALGTTEGTEARPLPALSLAKLASGVGAAPITLAVDRWVENLAASVRAVGADANTDASGRVVLIEPGEQVDVDVTEVVMPRRRGVWIPVEEPLRLWGRPTQGIVPLPAGAWAEPERSVRLSSVTAATALRDSEGWEGLWSFQAAALELLATRVAGDRQLEIDRQSELALYETDLRRATYEDLDALLRDDELIDRYRSVSGSDVLAAVRVIGESTGLPVVDPPAGALARAEEPLEMIARQSGFRTREVTLNRGWWTEDAGAFLGRPSGGRGWVALVPAGRRRYEAVWPKSGERVAVDAEVAASIGREAVQLYRPLPPGKVGGRELLRFACADVRKELRRLALAGSAIGLLSLLPTFVSQVIFNSVVPSGDRGRLVWLLALMTAGLAASGLLGLYQGFLSLRIETRATVGVQAAVFSRVIDLPARVLRRFSSTDLAVRAMGVDDLRETLSQYAVTSVLAVFVVAFNLVALLVIRPGLALFAIAAVAVAAGVLALGFRVVAAHQLHTGEARGRLFAHGTEVLGGVSKLRVASAEQRAFVQWARVFGEMKRAALRASRAKAVIATFFAAWPAAATGLVLLGAAVVGASSISAGTFIAFNTALTLVIVSIVTMMSSVLLVADSAPMYARMRPILEAEPEGSAALADPGTLRGGIDVSHVSFRYSPDGPLVLDDVNFTVSPGELVAVVGPSGSGKSSLLRLLLGFDTPENGMISYDGNDIADVDKRALRRQLGVVIQGTRLMPDDIYHNIVGTRRLSIGDAWAAAHMAGVDDFVRGLPMGMHTVVNEAGGAFSGGQRQLLLIARAMAGHPKVILLDEATSALDNHSQAVVMHNIEALNATRVVIAHRLSTVRNADRVLVLVGGHLVQQGTYEELADTPGPFADLIRRQVL